MNDMRVKVDLDAVGEVYLRPLTAVEIAILHPMPGVSNPGLDLAIAILICCGCDVDGTMMGGEHFDRWMEHYQRSSMAST